MDPTFIFHDRTEAGRALVPLLRDLAGQPGVIVLGVGRGGLAVAYEVASGLQAPLDLLSVGRIRMPGHEYVTIGAVTPDGACVLDKERIAASRLTAEAVEIAKEQAVRVIVTRDARFRASRPAADPSGFTVVLVDDGMASGRTMRSAAELVRTRRPRTLVVASPVGSEAACAELSDLADACVYLASPVPVGSIALWYRDFSTPDDSAVRAMLSRVIPAPPQDARSVSGARSRAQVSAADSRSSAA